jgi:DNA modification methylase
MNKLYFGDNLDVLRDHIKDESVDLIYLDPPFNSKRGYNLLHKTPEGHESKAQITAFQDTWVWGEQAEREFGQILESSNTNLAEMVDGMRRFMRESDMMAYLTMMARRLIELHRVLKPSGVLYLHCDPTASHYLKIVLDALFGAKAHFSNEIIWRRTTTKNDYKQGATNWARVHDVILMYYKDLKAQKIFEQPFSEYNEEYLEKTYRYVDKNGRRYTLDNLAAPGRGERGHPKYEFMGITRAWRYNKEKMQQLMADGRIIQSSSGKVPRYKRYLDEMPGVAISDVWDDIAPVQGQAKEFLGYPTQKPLALLERIIQASSKEGDVVLDPFCGCGTAIHAAQKLNRQWIGIDITHLAISLIEKRMRDAWKDIQFEVEGTPKDLEGARNLAERDKYQFQWWACSLVNAQPYQGKRKGADGGIDGLIFFKDIVDSKVVNQKIIISVKGGKNISLDMIKALITTVEHNHAQIGLFVTLAEPTQPMITEAAKASFYSAGNGRDYPRIQILTIDDLMSGRKKPEYLDFSMGQETFKQAPKEQPITKQDKLL